MPPVPKKVTEQSLYDAEEQNVEGPLIGWCRTKHIESLLMVKATKASTRKRIKDIIKNAWQ